MNAVDERKEGWEACVEVLEECSETVKEGGLVGGLGGC